MYILENNVEWTDNLKNAFKHGITKGKIKYINDNNEEVTIDYDNGLKSFKLYDEKNIQGQGFIGQATSRQVDLELLDITNAINLENKEFELFLGADYNNQTYYINYGKFIVNQAPENDTTNGTIKITAFDYMIKFNDLYVDTITYPCTLLALTQNICNQVGVILGNTNFANATFEVENNQFNGKTYREVIRHISKCAFSWARIGQDNKLYLDFSVNNTANIEIDSNEYYQDSFKKANEYYGPINRVIYAESNIEGQEEKVEDTTSIAQNGLHELVIYDNYFAYTTAKRQELIQAGTRLFGLKYMPIQQLDMVGLAYMDCQDILEVEDTDENTFNTIPLNHIIEYTGITKDYLTVEATSNNEEIYKNTNSPIIANNQVEIIVDRALRKIQLLVQNVINLFQSKSGTNNIFIDNIPTGRRYITKFVIKGDTTYFTETDITIVASEGIKNEETVLITEDGDTLITEDENTFLLENKSLYVDKIEISLDEVLRSLVVDGSTYYDELRILQDGTIQVVRRIGVVDETLYLLDREVITTLEEKFILPSNKNGYYYFVEELDNLKYYAEYIIENEYSDTFSTIVQLQSELKMLEDSITLSVSKKYETIENAELVEKEIRSLIQLQVNAINLSVAQMYNSLEASLELKLNTADLISEINASADIIRLIGQRLIIQMTNFTLDQYGNMTCTNGSFSGSITAESGNIAGFNINSTKFSKAFNTLYNFTSQDVQLLIGYLNDDNSLANELRTLYDVTGEGTLNIVDAIKIINIINGTVENETYVTGEVAINSNDSNNLVEIKNNVNINRTRLGIFSIYSYLLSAEIILLTDSDTNGYGIILDKGKKKITVKSSSGTTIILPTGITTPTLVQTSKAEDKKDFEKLENALEEVINTEIYSYHLKSQNEEDKKHIGFVIGEDFKYSHLITAENEEKEEIGVDTYSMVSVLWKAVQEQQKQIEKLQKEIEILKGEN